MKLDIYKGKVVYVTETLEDVLILEDANEHETANVIIGNEIFTFYTVEDDIAQQSV